MTYEQREEDFKLAVFSVKEFSAYAAEFFDYWSEPNKSRTKMKFEMEKTWDLTRRLRRWASNNFGKKEEVVQVRPIVLRGNTTRQAPVLIKKEISEEDMWAWIEEERAKEINLLYIPMMFFDFLISKNKIQLKRDHKLSALDYRKKQILVEIGAKTLPVDYLSKFEKSVSGRCLSQQEIDFLTILSKRFCLLEYLTNAN